jgi:hypothetical protein
MVSGIYHRSHANLLILPPTCYRFLSRAPQLLQRLETDAASQCFHAMEGFEAG